MNILIELPEMSENALLGTVEILRAVADAMEAPDFYYEDQEQMDGSFRVETAYGVAFVTPSTETE